MGGRFSKKGHDEHHHGYHTMEEEEVKKEQPFEQGRAWESRGTILGLLIDVAGRTAGPALMLVPMVRQVIYGRDSFLACETKKHPALKDDFWIYLCEYLSAFASAFPVLCTTALILVIGRNLLQKRLYYGMLQAGGIVTFCENNAFKDPIIWVVILAYFHVVAYFGLVIYICRVDGQLGFKEGVGLVMGDEDKRLILSFVSFMLLPATLFTGFYYGAYDIEGTLVPLSQFVHDAEDCADNAGESGEALADLQMMHDKVVKDILKHNEDEIFAAEGDHEQKHRSLLLHYIEHEDNYDPKDLTHITLWGSFWPGMLLLKPDMVGDAGKGFKTMWTVLLPIFLIIFFMMLAYIGFHVYEDTMKLVADQTKFQSYVHMAVFLGHLVVICALTWPFVQSVMWRFKKSPLNY